MIRKNARPLIIDFVRISKMIFVVRVSGFIMKRNGVEMISDMIAKIAQNVMVRFFCIDFFS
jgi:hypothetical protein